MKKLTSLILAGLLLLTSCKNQTAVDPVTGETAVKETQSDPLFTEEETAPYEDPVGTATYTATEEVVTRTTHLTGIFKYERLPRLNNSYYNYMYTPVYDDDGNVRVYGTFNSIDPDKRLLATVNPEGEVVDYMEVIRYNLDNIDDIAATEDTIYYVQRTTNRESGELVGYIAACGAYNSGELISLNNMLSTNQYGYYNMTELCLDKNGNVYVSTETEIAILKPDLTPITTLKPAGGVTAMAVDADGTVWIASGEGDAYGLYPIDPDTQKLGTPRLLGSLRIDNLFFAPGYDFYYSDYTTAVFGVNFTGLEDKPTYSTVVMDFQSSNVAPNEFTLLGVIDKENILAANKSRTSSGGSHTPLLYKKQPDRPLEDIVVIEVAYTSSDYYFETDVMEFNRTHSNIMVVLQDYSRFNNAIDPNAGETRLAMDVVTGVYRPDIILGTYDQPVVKAVVDNGDFFDLSPYLRADPEVNESAIFPSVLYSYSTDAGKVWGLPVDFGVKTVVSSNALTGGLTDWNHAEMLDFASKLPRNLMLMQNLSQENAVEKLFGTNAYAAFVDLNAGTCNFDTPEFTQLLDLLKSQPVQERSVLYQDEHIARFAGEVVLYPHKITQFTDWLAMEVIFNTKDFSLIGYPVAENSTDKSAQLAFSESYTLLSDCKNRNEAWEFIRFMLGSDYVYTHFHMARGLPIMMEECRGMAKESLPKIYDFYYVMGGYHASEPYTDEAREWYLSTPPREPSVRIFPEEYMIDEYMEFLTNGVGQRITDRIPDEISKIVNEEIESFLTGTKTASDCARIIQSRVNIWLAEHE